jgi:hypothetical protein
MPKRNPFEPLTIQEQLDIENRKKALAAQMETTAKLAAECLDDPKFQKYRDEFIRMRTEVFENMKQPIDADPIKDAYYLRACINTIIVLNQILEKPQKDAKKGNPA